MKTANKWLIGAVGGCGCLVVVVIAAIVSVPFFIQHRVDSAVEEFEKGRAESTLSEIKELFRIACPDPTCEARAAVACGRVDASVSAGKIDDTKLRPIRDRLMLGVQNLDDDAARAAAAEGAISDLDAL